MPLHALDRGRRARFVRLPEKAVRVRELFAGKEFDSNELMLETDGPDTWLFKATAPEL